MRKFILLIAITLISSVTFAQDFPFGEVSQEEMDMQKYDKDTSAHALVLNEHGRARISETNSEDVNLIFDHHIKIKFFDDKEFERYGTFEIPVYSSDGLVYEKLVDVKAITYYKDDAGNLQKAELDPKKIFRVEQDKHHTLVKFAMPALRKGCIIDIKYEIESPYYWNHFHSWMFQDYLPKLNSQFEALIPGFWNYNASLRGYLKLTDSKADIERECFTFHGAKCDCSHLTFTMKDVPAFVREEYMTSPNNYLSGVYWQLVEFTNLQTGAKEKYSKDWKDLDRELKEQYWFGGQLKRKEMLKDRVAPAIAGKTDSLSKAKAVYTFIQKSFKWNERDNDGSVDGIKKALDAHTGDAGDINLALVNALTSAGVPAEAVLISTRENGSINKLYPTINDFDYVIARTSIDGKVYLLDATDPMLPFGMLPLRCLNDEGRVFSVDKPSYWMDMNTAQRAKTTYNIDLTLGDDGKLKGNIIRYSSSYSGYLRRKEIKKYNSLDEYVDHLSTDMPGTKILKSDIVNVDSLDMPVGETYQVEMNAFDGMNHDRLGFNPFIIGKIKTNPFKLAHRDYPVDMGIPSEERYIITVHLPAQYAIENPPQGLAFSMASQGGRFITDFQNDGSTFTFSYVTQINSSVFGTDEYTSLKELFNRIVTAEKTQLVFKKKS
ncbi:DUF3857 domain-containing protein [Mucilaginibacter ginsenosidivorans]|uniref:DUF3857 domain-containing protein n=1 Tax=Mucilaginibacter ginsenosidivorans TaxID=398053 RepID=A0A5B8UWV2_9SPHI|nr:DUF3857 domain-containing protein [Mucilaginibacter ginsenosidivorans]QEC63524.1 DUF3857 domain-containing protein [Mucilaginibacter ginsenosidivorans]